MLDKCIKKGAIDTIPEVPGILVFMNAHVGVYIGNGEVIEAKGHAYGVVKTKLKGRGWKNWGYCPYITYVAEKLVKEPVNKPQDTQAVKNPEVKTNTPKFEVGKTYTLTSNMNVRTGAGTNYSKKKRNQLTADGKKHSLTGVYAVLKNGTKVTSKAVKKVGNDVWIQIPSGWIAGYYGGKIYIK